MTAPAIDFVKLLEGIPPGAWVAISSDQARVVAYAPRLDEAIEKAREEGEPEPIMVRVPESQSALLL